MDSLLYWDSHVFMNLWVSFVSLSHSSMIVFSYGNLFKPDIGEHNLAELDVGEHNLAGRECRFGISGI